MYAMYIYDMYSYAMYIEMRESCNLHVIAPETESDRARPLEELPFPVSNAWASPSPSP